MSMIKFCFVLSVCFWALPAYGQQSYGPVSIGAYYMLLSGTGRADRATWVHYLNVEGRHESSDRLKAAGNVLLAYNTGSQRTRSLYCLAAEYDLAGDPRIGVNFRLGVAGGKLQRPAADAVEGDFTLNIALGFSLDYQVRRRFRVQTGLHSYSPIGRPDALPIAQPFVGILLNTGKISTP